MKKKMVLSMALLSAVIAAGSTPSHANAAGVNVVKGVVGNCYKVYISQKNGCNLSQALKDFCVTLPECTPPSATNPPATETPAPTTPAAQTPVPTTPAVETPDAQEPEIDTPVEETSSQAEQVVKLVNEERTKAGLPALTVNADITTAANVRANEIKRVFSHTRPDGSSFSTALKEQGVSFRGSGENIAWGQKSPEQVMNAWMNSAGHRANILNKNFKNVGVGHYQDENGTNYWVQLFTY